MLPKRDYWLQQALLARLVVDLGVWISPETYSVLPLLVPFAVRDPDSKGNAGRGIPYRWGEVDDLGFLRDDNSMIKDKPYSLRVTGSNPLYSGKRIDKGFKASHVWRRTTEAGHAARTPSLFSFVPNLVWLPGFLADMSDREASFTQTYLQAIAIHVYKDLEVSEQLRPWTESAWASLPAPIGIPEEGLPDASTLNFFEHSQSFVASRAAAVERISDALAARAAGREPAPTRPSAFGRTLTSLDRRIAQERADHLAKYAAAVRSAVEEHPILEVSAQ